MPQTRTRPAPTARTAENRRRKTDGELQLREDFAALIASEQGRRIAWAFLEQCAMRQPVFNANAMVMSNNAGKHELGLWLESQLRESSLDNYLKMITENGS